MFGVVCHMTLQNKTSLLLGNGINFLGDSQGLSWKELLLEVIDSIGKENIIDIESKRNYLFLYEEIFTRAKKYTNLGNEYQLQSMIAQKIQNNIKPNSYHTKIYELGFTNILTTNYDYALENALGFNTKKNKEKKYSLYRKYTEYYSDTTIWHIHGEINNPNSIILGYDFYIKSIYQMQRYIKKYLKPYPNKDYKNSWVDIFLYDDIYILGLTLDFDEYDLWFLLSYRNREALKNRNIFQNKITYIYFECENSREQDKEKLTLLDVFGVSIYTIKLFNCDYKQGYDTFIKDFENGKIK